MKYGRVGRWVGFSVLRDKGCGWGWVGGTEGKNVVDCHTDEAARGEDLHIPQIPPCCLSSLNPDKKTRGWGGGGLRVEG